MNPLPPDPHADAGSDAPHPRDDRIASFLDDDPLVPDPLADLAPDTCRDLADQLFVDALLRRWARGEEHGVPASAADADRIWRAVSAQLGESARRDESASIGLPHDAPRRPTGTDREAPGPIPTRRRTRTAWGVVLVAACALVGLVGLWSGANHNTAAAAAVERSLETALQPKDRSYRVTADVRRPDGTDRTLHATLDVRGADRFVLTQPALFGPGEVRIGRDGQVAWLVPRLGPVFVAEDLAGLEARWGLEPPTTPYLQIATILHRMRGRYVLTEAPPPSDRATGSATEPRCRTIVGTLRRPVAGWPSRIEVCVEHDTGNARRLELTWTRREDEPGPRRVLFELTDETPRPDTHYGHAAHHAPDRRVLRVGA